MKRLITLAIILCLIITHACNALAARNYAHSWVVIATPAPVLTCTYSFYTPFIALDFANCVYDLGIYMNYKPAVYFVGDCSVCVDLFTSCVYGLSDYDYLMAYAIDELFYWEFAT